MAASQLSSTSLPMCSTTFTPSPFSMSKLCVICENLDLDHAVRNPSEFSKLWSKDRRIPFDTLANFRPDCRLCKFILDIMMDSSRSGRRPGPIEFMSVELFDSVPGPVTNFGAQFSMPALKIMERHPDGWSSIHNTISIQKTNHQLLRTLPAESVDYEGIQRVLASCEQQHGSSCLNQRQRTDLSYLRIIDCSSRKLIAVENRRFAALSYVWGPQAEHESYSNWHPVNNHQLPKTIEDAIFVAKKIGVGFLWVDRYCIDQSDDDDVRRHIADMDQIYQRATITIIDCVGSNPYNGLPGVSATSPRRRLKETTISDFQFIETGMGISHLLRFSPWWERAWTFQEGLFSRRRLSFTSEMVYFECGSSSWCETTSPSFPYSQTHRGLGAHEQFIPLFPNGIHSCVTMASHHLEEYANRELTKPNDILHAISGVLHAFESNGSGFKHIWGLPIFPSMTRCSTRHGFDRLLVEIPPYMWDAGLSISFALAWDALRLSERRDGFPSWSWCGWIRPLPAFPWLSHMEPCEAPLFTEVNTSVKECSVEFELVDGKVVDWNTVLSYKSSEQEVMVSRYIHITAPTTPVTIIPHESCQGIAEIHAEAISGYKCSLTMRLTSAAPLPHDALIIHLIQTWSSHTSAPGKTQEQLLKQGDDNIPWPRMLLVAMRNGVYERIGTMYSGIRVCNDDGDEVVKWSGFSYPKDWGLRLPEDDMMWRGIPPEQLQGYGYLHKEVQTIRLG